MIRILVASALLLLFAGSVDSSGPRQPGSQAVTEAEPDPRKARALDRWPNDEDLARLESVKGKPKVVILQVLGHPYRIQRKPDGEEVWIYPWSAYCEVKVRNNVCTDTFYTGGY